MPDAYRRGAPCRVRVRRRGDRFDMDDLGAAVELAGRPAGWLAEGRSVVAREGFNINRQGRVFVQGFAGRDIDDLADRLAEVSRAVHEALLSLDD